MSSQARFYDRYWQREGGSPADGRFLIDQRKSVLEKALGQIPRGESILDAGCGNGEFSRFISGLGYRVTSVDISTHATRRAKTRFPKGQFCVASLQGLLPFSVHDCFSAVWCSEVLEHLFDTHAVLAEFNRVLKPGGRLVLTVPYHSLVKNLVIALTCFEKHYSPYVSHIRFFTRASLQQCLSNAGFEPIVWSGIGRRWPLWMCHVCVAVKRSDPNSLAMDIIG